MDALGTASEFLDLYADVYRHAYRRRDPRAPRISGEGLAMLEHLRDSGPLTIGEAARHFDRSQSSISERFRRLAERGFVESIPDERDQRRHLLWLTPAGEARLRAELDVLSREALAGAVARMEPNDRRALLDGMRALVRAVRETAPNERKEK